MIILRNSLLLLTACLLLNACGAASPAARAEEEARRVATATAIEKGDFLLDITQIIPRGYPSRSSTGEYTLRLKDGVVTTRLPFLGESRMPVFGGVDDISIVFDGEKVDLRRDFSDAGKGEYRYQFQSGGQDAWTVTLQLYDNGRAYIGCNSRSGRTMSFIANVLLPEDDEKK